MSRIAVLLLPHRDLDGAIAIEPRIARFPYFTHAAFADLRDDRIRSEPAGSESGQGFRRQLLNREVEYSLATGHSRRQPLDILLQFGIGVGQDFRPARQGSRPRAGNDSAIPSADSRELFR